MAGAISERGIPAVVDVVAEPGFDPHPPPGMVNRQRRSTTGGLNPFGNSGLNLGHVGMASRTRPGVGNRMNVDEHMVHMVGSGAGGSCRAVGSLRHAYSVYDVDVGCQEAFDPIRRLVSLLEGGGASGERVTDIFDVDRRGFSEAPVAIPGWNEKQLEASQRDGIVPGFPSCR